MRKICQFHCATKPSLSRSLISFTLIPLLCCYEDGNADASSMIDFTQLSIEELMNIEVTSTAKQAQPLADAASAIFVITQEDLRRTGVTSVPEALRMVPGMQVARIDANKWSVTARGFNGRFANKLLVLIDGRTVYTPTFSGVYWEVQDLLLEDIERIEVIRGPGASLWGANAVNGVINILTKHAVDTQGGLVSLTMGDEERAIVGLRYGGQVGEHGYYRLYGKYLERDDLVDRDGEEAGDNWDMQRAGFRFDWDPTSRHGFSFQGDLYKGSLDQNVTVPVPTPPFAQVESDNIHTSGGYLQGRWEFTQSPTSQFTVQTYYQREERDDLVGNEERDTVDMDLQHNVSWGEHHEIVWGLGYRYSQDEFINTELFSWNPDHRDTHLFSAFLQDTIGFFNNRFAVTVGSKLEHNDYTGWEVQPSLRALWTPHPEHRLWAAVSQAVRTPGRGEQDGRTRVFVVPPTTPSAPPILAVLNGDRGFDAEQLTAYELGYRTWPTENVSLDMVGFLHDYDDLLGIEAGTPFLEFTPNGPLVTLPGSFNNKSGGRLFGLELAAAWRPFLHWELQLAYTYLDSELDLKRGAETRDKDTTVPRHQVSLRSFHDLGNNLEADLWLRYTDELSGLPNSIQGGRPIRIDDYVAFDLRLGWQPSRNLEFSLVGRNLLDDNRFEFVQELYTFPTQVERSLYGQLKWSFR